jgi:hypothetical protein
MPPQRPQSTISNLGLHLRTAEAALQNTTISCTRVAYRSADKTIDLWILGMSSQRNLKEGQPPVPEYRR